MSLTKEQYNRIMRTLQDRRLTASTLQEKRQEEVEEQIPVLLSLNEKLSELSVNEVIARLKKTDEEVKKIRSERQRLMDKKYILLEENGFPADYLEIKYECPYCKDTGYIGNEKCGCMKRLESEILNEESNLPKIFEAENFETFSMAVFDNKEPIDELLPNYKITQAEYMKKNILPAVKQYIIDFGKTGHKNMLLTGPAGTGKTFITNCVAKWLIERQHTVIYERAAELFDLMSKKAFSRESDEETDSKLERIENCELLVIDDLGTEFVTEYTKSRLFSLISHRLSCNLSTIISSNLSVNQISKTYGERVASRIVGEYMLLPFYGKDIRTKI